MLILTVNNSRANFNKTVVKNIEVIVTVTIIFWILIDLQVLYKFIC